MSGTPLRAPVALGIVGCGRLAEAGYLPALADVAAVEVAAVADPDVERRARIARLAGGAAEHADARSLLASSRVDGIVIASPAAAHVDDAERAAAAGVPALVEKPPAPDLRGARRLAALDPGPHIAFNRRFDPGARHVRAAVAAAQRAGSRRALAVRAELSYRRDTWMPHQVDDDALADLGPHLVDWVRWVTSSEVRAVRSAQLSRSCAVIELTLEAGTARLVARTDRPHREHLSVAHVGGRLIASHDIGGVARSVLARVGGGGPSALVQTLQRELCAFAAVASGTRTTSELATAADGVAAMAVIDAARTSAARGGAVEIAPDLLSPRPTTTSEA